MDMSLWLFQNRFTGSVPTELGGMTKMSEAVIITRNNFIPSSIPTELGRLVEMKSSFGFEGIQLTGPGICASAKRSNANSTLSGAFMPHAPLMTKTDAL